MDFKCGLSPDLTSTILSNRPSAVNLIVGCFDITVVPFSQNLLDSI